jgi:hypothetical protein
LHYTLRLTIAEYAASTISAHKSLIDSPAFAAALGKSE